jgi:hypothetical protein
MAPASLHNNHEAARGNPEPWSRRPDERAGPCRRRPITGRYRRPTATPTTACRELEQRRPMTSRHPCLLPRSRCNLQHHPDGTPVDAWCQLALVLAPLAERSSRRHTRSPGEAGGGRSDLCHDNDEPDPVNRRTRVGDNIIDQTAELLAGDGCRFELVSSWLSSGNEQVATDSEEWKPQLGDDWERPQCPRRCHVERLPVSAVAIVLQPRVHDGHIGEAKLDRGCLDPIESPALRIDEREGS